MNNRIILLLLTFLICLSNPSFGQKKSNESIQKMVEKFKADDRGPYRDIRWFCKDGTINMPKEPCEEEGGKQHARYKEEVERLAETNHIFLGQILTNTSRTDFWDAKNYNSRLKQYQVEKFLRAADDGWILQKGQYYRGAFQVEDEEEWGIDFFDLILKSNSKIKENFYLIRQAAKDIPHAGDTDRMQNIRALSKSISEDYAPFFDLRVKIHGQPDETDLETSRKFLENNREKMKERHVQDFEEMLRDMEVVYRPLDLEELNKKYVRQLPKGEIKSTLETYVDNFKDKGFSLEKMKAIANILFDIRQDILKVRDSKDRLALLDISIALEDALFKGSSKWEMTTAPMMMEKIYYLGKASTGCGYLEMWEWEKLKDRVQLANADNLTADELTTWHENARRLVEWSAGITRGVYKNAVELFSGFEPMAYGFYDDKIRSSILLPLGNSVSDLGNVVAEAADFSNQVLDLTSQSSFRGLNPGYALGELVVVDGSSEGLEVSSDKIYVFYSPPSDLKPVTGIATVTEGNMVSHVQLLARNLGIPNVVLSEDNLKELKKYSGKKIFFAVSNKGTVIMKLEKDMNDVERKLFEVKKRNQEKIAVPIDEIRLDNTAVLDLRDVKSKDSGKICGPKAANLGQLKNMFPDQVVEGVVIPFSIFRQHMDQDMPNQEMTYWGFLNNMFAEAGQIGNEKEEENYMLRELAIFRKAIEQIEFRSDFLKDFSDSFAKAMGEDLGKVPVFLRSDTNMEDLKDFTGAGLNLTLFNVLDKNEILQGIRKVWASPYTERSYKWRQKYLLNPENVYPSILIIPSVDVDYSGVLITKGITSGKSDDMTIAFSRGAGGAVDGQAAESYLLTAGGENLLLSPARESSYLRLPESGGTNRINASFNEPILNKSNLQDIRKLTDDVNRILPNTEGVESSGPFDIELGFKDNKMWLFQIRPFVENKNAKGSAYLESITPGYEGAPLSGETSANEPSANGISKIWYALIGAVVLGLIGFFIYIKKTNNEL